MRARQNVVFEHGYLIGRLGRSNVCALVKDDIENQMIYQELYILIMIQGTVGTWIYLKN